MRRRRKIHPNGGHGKQEALTKWEHSAGCKVTRALTLEGRITAVQLEFGRQTYLPTLPVNPYLCPSQRAKHVYNQITSV